MLGPIEFYSDEPSAWLGFSNGGQSRSGVRVGQIAVARVEAWSLIALDSGCLCIRMRVCFECGLLPTLTRLSCSVSTRLIGSHPAPSTSKVSPSKHS